MLALAFALYAAIVLPVFFRKWRAGRVEEWVRQQRNIANFRYAGEPSLEERLRLRAAENRRLKPAFGIDNSLTTESPATHKAFLQAANRLLNRNNRSWEQLYRIAETFLDAEVRPAMESGHGGLHLAESVRCMVLAVVLFDSFGTDPSTVPRSALVTITEEINNQWLLSKCHPDDLTPSALLNSAIASLNITSPSEHRTMTPAEVLSLLMPQYETLWRVVLLTFATAYHHQPAAHPEAVHRTAGVPSCLGDPAREKEALKLAKVSRLPFPNLPPFLHLLSHRHPPTTHHTTFSATNQFPFPPHRKASASTPPTNTSTAPAPCPS
jgi:hypothetical protein